MHKGIHRSINLIQSLKKSTSGEIHWEMTPTSQETRESTWPKWNLKRHIFSTGSIFPQRRRRCFRTYLRNKGLISAGRRTKPTPMLTIPRFLFKSSTKDKSLPIFGIVIQHSLPPTFASTTEPRNLMIQARRHIVILVTSGEVNIVAFQHGFGLRGVQP